MIAETLEELKFPIGKFSAPAQITPQHIEKWIDDISSFPRRLKAEVSALSEEQLNTPYRPEGWTIKQVVHHCADSHINSLMRFKLALTEDTPVIKPYLEARWAELADVKQSDISYSLLILEGIHHRWTILMKSLSASNLEKGFIHPEHGREIKLRESIGMYAWHCNHHLAHITSLKSRKNWV